MSLLNPPPEEPKRSGWYDGLTFFLLVYFPAVCLGFALGWILHV